MAFSTIRRAPRGMLVAALVRALARPCQLFFHLAVGRGMLHRKPGGDAVVHQVR